MKLIECVPNFSEGRNQSIIDEIIAPIKDSADVHLLDVDPGYDTNRTVVTFIGEPESVIAVAFKCIEIASNLIDMSKHSGEHPRMGATDVCPLIPLQNVSMKECINYSKTLASKVGRELNIPIFLYENSSKSKFRSNLSDIRKGEYEGMKVKLKDPKWRSDYGPKEFNDKSGTTAIGAREFLIAYNVNLNTFDRKIATDIALDIRESGRAKRDAEGKIIRDDNGKIIKKKGKFKFCKAVGWYIDEYNQAQVSINLTNYKKTSIHKVFEEVRKQARKRGVRVTGSEIVGLVPLQAMIDSGKYYLGKQRYPLGIPQQDIVQNAIQSLGLSDISKFDQNDKIIEYKINSNDNSFKKLKMDDFLNVLSRGTPTPGGGSISALAGSLGAALTSMVANLSFNKKSTSQEINRYNQIGLECQKLKDSLLDLVDKDSKSYDLVIDAIRLPKKTDKDKKRRLQEIEKATIHAADIPMQILELSIQLMKKTLLISEIGNKNSITDSGVAGYLIHSAGHGASLNVLINIKTINSKIEKEYHSKIDYYIKDLDDLFLKLKNNVDSILNND
ncbi:MAG: glutamate formimidoyltransferase [Candidatus Marinimicrobia bacterium]|nr:glutamate formimidoyltransferase [Candidatus Neomarinimicrobiota bacterium]